jgi:hypothetical protein
MYISSIVLEKGERLKQFSGATAATYTGLRYLTPVA